MSNAPQLRRRLRDRIARADIDFADVVQFAISLRLRLSVDVVADWDADFKERQSVLCDCSWAVSFTHW